MKIQRVRASAVSVGDQICDVDDDELTSDLDINLDYDVDTADWQLVCGIRGHADVGEFLLQMRNGERRWAPRQSWSSYVWRLANDNDQPVKTEVDES